MRLCLFLTAIAAFFLLSGCAKEDPPKAVGSMLDMNSAPEVLIFDKDKVEPEKADPGQQPNVIFVMHPDERGKTKVAEVNELTENRAEDAGIILKALTKTDLGNQYLLRLLIFNDTKVGGTINVYVFSYDDVGKMSSARKDLPYLSAGEHYLMDVYLPKTPAQVRWVFKATMR
ncbi:MAG: hypothetical protein WC712_00575 [Candidatus Brocadiia bacterium]